MRSAVVGGNLAHYEAALLEPVDDLHQGRPVEPERPGYGALADARIGFDQDQGAELRRLYFCRRRAPVEMLEHRDLGTAQIEADQLGQQPHIDGVVLRRFAIWIGRRHHPIVMLRSQTPST